MIHKDKPIKSRDLLIDDYSGILGKNPSAPSQEASLRPLTLRLLQPRTKLLPSGLGNSCANNNLRAE